MNVTVTTKKTFEPFTLSIEFETLEEVGVLFERLDLPAERVREGLPTCLNDNLKELDNIVRSEIMKAILNRQ